MKRSKFRRTDGAVIADIAAIAVSAIITAIAVIAIPMFLMSKLMGV